MSNRLPDIIKPLHLADTRQSKSGYLPLDIMPRLAPLLADVRGSADVDLEFGIDEQKVRYIKGQLRTTLCLVCQRCFEGMPYPVNTEIMLGMVTTMDEADLLPESYEPLLLNEPVISLPDMIEDELLLLLPQVIRHGEDECSVEMDYSTPRQQESDEQGETQNPFAVLEQLKNSK